MNVVLKVNKFQLQLYEPFNQSELANSLIEGENSNQYSDTRFTPVPMSTHQGHPSAPTGTECVRAGDITGSKFSNSKV
jgi:hypothetical protein